MYRGCVPLSLLILTLCAASADADGYFVDEGGPLFKVENSDAETAAFTEWQVRLYPAGVAPGTSGKHWGVIAASSASKVMEELWRSQEMQLWYDKALGIDPMASPTTYFNFLGPIGMRRPTHDKANRLIGLLGTLNKLRKIGSRARDILSPKDANTKVGRTIRDYLGNLRDAERRVREFEKDLIRDYEEHSEASKRALAEIEASLGRTDASKGGVLALLPPDPEYAEDRLPDVAQLPPPQTPSVSNPAKKPDSLGQFRVETNDRGEKTSEGHYIGNKRHGHFIEWGTDEVKRDGITTRVLYKYAEGGYVNDVKEGAWTQSCSANCVLEGQYRNGRKVGQWQKYWYDNVHRVSWTETEDYGSLTPIDNPTERSNRFPDRLKDFLPPSAR